MSCVLCSTVLTPSPAVSLPSQALLFLSSPHSTATAEAKVQRSALLLPLCWRLVPRLAAVAGNSALVNTSSRMSAVWPSPALVVLMELGPMGFFSF